MMRQKAQKAFSEKKAAMVYGGWESEDKRHVRTVGKADEFTDKLQEPKRV